MFVFDYTHANLDSCNDSLLYKVMVTPMYACSLKMYDILEHDNKTVTVPFVTQDKRVI